MDAATKNHKNETIYKCGKNWNGKQNRAAFKLIEYIVYGTHGQYLSKRINANKSKNVRRNKFTCVDAFAVRASCHFAN